VAQNQTAKAAAELEIAVELRPDYAQAWSDLRAARRLLSDIKGGQEALERAVVLNPHDETTHYRLGLVYLANRKPHKAIGHFQAALRHDPYDGATLYNLALTY